MSSPVEFDLDVVGEVAIIRAKGILSLGGGDLALRNAVQSALERGIKKIVLDMSGVSRTDSSGLGELVTSYTKVTSEGGRFVLLAPNQAVSNALQITRLSTVFTVATTVEQALAEASQAQP